MSISFSDYVFDDMIRDFRGNRSKHIERFFCAGFDQNLSESSWKAEKTKMLSKIAEQETEIRELKRQLGKYQTPKAIQIEALSEKEQKFLQQTIRILETDPSLIQGRLNYFNNAFYIPQHGEKLKLREFVETLKCIGRGVENGNS